MSIFSAILSDHAELIGRMGDIEERVNAAGRAMASGLAAGRKVMLCGNGGSASDSQHIAAELVGRFVHDRRALAAIALSTDTSALTAIANDYAFDAVFARQVEGLGRYGDCLIGISTSGNSPNVFNAMEKAKALGLVTIGLLGRDGGRIAHVSDIAIVVPSAVTARIQEMHIVIGHALCALVEEELGLSE